MGWESAPQSCASEGEGARLSPDPVPTPGARGPVQGFERKAERPARRRGSRNRADLHPGAELATTILETRPSTQGDAERARAGDHAAYERLYREHVAHVHALARRMAGDDMADDLTQEVFIRAWEKLATFRGEAAFRTWLHRLAVNWILSRRATRRRREARRAGDDAVLDDLEGRRARPGLEVDLERAMARLPDGARRVFVLYDVEGYAHDEIADLLGISVGTSKSQLHRARMLLRRRLDADGVDENPTGRP